MMITQKKRSKPQSPSLSSLPDDVLLIIFACISRLYYPVLALVSKRFRSLLASPMLYRNRSSFGRIEPCLYVALRFPSDLTTRWFMLCRTPDRALANDVSRKSNKRSRGYALATISIPRSPPVHTLGLVSVGSDIYSIGGSTGNMPSSRVSVLDCRFNTWREAPRMKMSRYHPSSNVYEDKIYVTGGSRCGHASHWMEVFDIKTQTWEFVKTPSVNRFENNLSRSVLGYEGVAYIPKQEKWEGTVGSLDLGWVGPSYCVIDDILYCYTKTSGIEWYDIKVGIKWHKLNGLRGLPIFSEYSRVKLADYGGKLVVLWDKGMLSSGKRNRMMWCAVIELDVVDNTMAIWGDVESVDPLLVVPESYEFVCALSATV